MDDADQSKAQKSKRIVRSREHTAMEKQKKRRVEKEKVRGQKSNSKTSVKIANGVTAKLRDQEKTAPVSQKPTHPSPQNGDQIVCIH